MKFLQAVQSKLMLLEQDAPPAPPADAAMPADPNAAPAAPATAPATPSEVDQIGDDANQKVQEFASNMTVMMKNLLNIFSIKFNEQLSAEDAGMQAFSSQINRLKQSLDSAGKDITQLNAVERIIEEMQRT
jgi:hypothetical protein